MILTLRVTDEQKARWDAAAAEAGLKLSEWVRSRCDERERIVRETPLRIAEQQQEEIAIRQYTDFLGTETLREAKTGEPQCIHGTRKGWNCWKCGGIAQCK